MKAYHIVVLPGDGIGAEVMAEARKALHAVVSVAPGLNFSFEEVSVGAGEYLRSGNPLPDRAFTACHAADAILLGAMGLPGVRWPDGREMTPQIDLRERLDLYAGLRPIRAFHPNHSPLKNPEGIDMLLVRENCEGLFWSRRNIPPENAEVVEDILHISRHGAERICRVAFENARKRRNRVTLVDKANVLPSMVLFRRVFDEVAQKYPDIETERVYVDAMALYLVQRPQVFDVIVTENIFGDILSDLAAGIIGGMGLAPSADIGPKHAVFQPSHGTAPDIAGQGIANPVAMILSAGMMLDWLGHPDSAKRIENAVAAVLSDPDNRTKDLGGSLSTTAIGDRIAEKIVHA